MGGEALLGSPFHVKVVAGEAHGPSSLARGDGVARARQREPASFEVFLRDAAGNECSQGGEPLRVSISPRASHGGDYGEVLSVTDRLDGSFLVSYVCGLSGRYLIAITLRGEPVQGSPFAVHVPLETATPRSSAAQAQSMRAPRGASPLRAAGLRIGHGMSATPLFARDEMVFYDA